MSEGADPVGIRAILGDVAARSVPKTMLVARRAPAARSACDRSSRTATTPSIGVLGVVSVVTPCLIAGSSVHAVAVVPGGATKTLDVEHPTGTTGCVIEPDDAGTILGAAMLRTARNLFDGLLFG